MVYRWHAPHRAPVHPGGIVFRIQFHLVVNSAIIAISAVFRQRINIAVTPLVGAQVIVILGFNFAPGEVIAIFLKAFGADVAGRPQRATGQPQVNIFLFMVDIVDGYSMDWDNALTAIKCGVLEGHGAIEFAWSSRCEHHGDRGN